MKSSRNLNRPARSNELAGDEPVSLRVRGGDSELGRWKRRDKCHGLVINVQDMVKVWIDLDLDLYGRHS